MRNRKMKFWVCVVLSAFFLYASCSNGSDDNTLITIKPTYTEDSTSLNKNSCVEYIYDKTNFVDYKEIRTYDSGGLILNQVEYFFYSADEVKESSLEDSIKQSLIQDLEGFSYDKGKKSGKYLSMVFNVNGLEYKPVEKNYYSISNEGSSRTLVVSYDYDAAGNLETVPSNIIFDGLVDSVNGTLISYKSFKGGSIPAQHKKVRIDFDPSEDNKVTYYRVLEYDTDLLVGGYDIKETEYSTYDLKCTVSGINSQTSVENDFDFMLNKVPVLSYCNETPLDKLSADKKKWYQVNRTINFFSDTGDVNKTMYTVYKMSWDTNVFSDYFILQTEYNTDSKFETIGERIKSVSVIPASSNKLCAYLFIYGDTTQRKRNFYYSNYPALSESENPNASVYNSLYGNNEYVSKESEYERISEKSLDLTEKSYSTTHYYIKDGGLCMQSIEYSTTADSAGGSNPQTGGDADFNSNSMAELRMVLDL